MTNDPDGNFTIKILDFGIAKIISEEDEQDKGWVVGTPLYMSPEQVKGGRIDERSDIYAMGVLLHQMLTGRAPYDTTTLSELEIQNKVITDPLPRMKDFYPNVSEKVQKIVDKATQKEPDRRYDSCSDFHKAWKKAIIGEQIPFVVKYAGILLFALLLGGCWWIWDYNHTKIVYYKDYVEQWGIPQGIDKLSSGEFHHRAATYCFEYKKGKLQHMVYVNSKGNVIDDGESEHQERPINATFIYRDNGSLEYVNYLDRNNKVLFKKNYREKDGKINMVVFEYGDKYGAERFLPKKFTNKYTKLADESGEKGKVSRFLLEFDKNGYISMLHYANPQNQIIEDMGICGKKYERDSKGRVLKEIYLGYHDAVKATSWGLAMQTYKYDSNDNWIETDYFAPDGSPAFDCKDGLSIYTLDYDEYGNLVSTWYRASDRSLMITKRNGCAGQLQKYNDAGQLVELMCLGIDKRPMYVKNAGLVGVRFEYDRNGYVSRKIYLDEKGQPMINFQGLAIEQLKNDAKGNVLENQFFDTNNKPVEIVDGYARFVARYDSLGNQISWLCYNISNALCLNKEGIAGYYYEYNDQNKITKQTVIGVDGKPKCDNNGIYIAKFEYDERGNEVKRTFYDATGRNYTLSTEKIAGWNSKYDENGNEIERTFFNVKGVPTECNSGYAICRSTFDLKGNELTLRYYNTANRLATCSDGYAGINWKYDEKGNIIEEVRIDASGRYVTHSLITRYKYDKYDNVIETAYFNYENSPAINASGYHKMTDAYDSRNQKLEERYYGVHNELVEYNHTQVAIFKYQYNTRGFLVETSYWGINGQPAIGNEGYAKMRNAFDVMGRLIRQTYYDVSGRPTSPEVMVPEGLVQYDKWGNMRYIAAANGHGRLIINPKLGWAVKRSVYDIRGNELSEEYFDAQDKPCETKQNYHKIIYEYDKNWTLKSTKYYKLNGNLQAEQKAGSGTTSNATAVSNNNVSSASQLASVAKEINSHCPIDMVNGQIVIQSANCTGKTIMYNCRLPEYSKYNIDDNTLSDLMRYIKESARKEKYVNVLIANKITVVLLVNDKANRLLFKVNY